MPAGTKMPYLSPEQLNGSHIDALNTTSPFAYAHWQTAQHDKNSALWQFLSKYPLGQPLSLSTIQDWLAQCADDDKVIVKKNLRILRQNAMVRWIWQDALGLLDLVSLMNELSAFANACLDFVYQMGYQLLSIRYGMPMVAEGRHQICDELAIIAMGKLGAGELNLSSDIDLIFVHWGNGQTNGKKMIETQKFMTNLGRFIIEMLDERTPEGFVFRVDMRLRPWGDGSPLVMGVGALEKYFALHGRTWERFAWAKASIVNKISPKLKEHIEQLQKTFVYRYYVDYSAFSALREMRQLISNQVAQREDLDNVKLGIGGIRDIEFIAQSFALIYGGHYPTLMNATACLDALNQLQHLRFIDEEVFENLSSAYQFLRQTEHRIQARFDTQSQKLPTGDDLMQLAVAMGFLNSDEFLLTLNHHRQKVRSAFERLIEFREQISDTHYNQSKQHNKEMAAWIDKDTIQKQFEGNKEQLYAYLNKDNQDNLTEFFNSKLIKNLSDEAKNRLHQVYPLMAYALLNFVENDNNNPTDDNDRLKAQINLVLPRLLGLLETIAKRSIYLIMLKENPNALLSLLRLLASGAWIAGELRAYPVLLDTLLQKRYQHLPDKAELQAILSQTLLSVPAFDDENFLMSLRLFKKTQVLAVAESDVLNQHPIMKVSDSLTFIAEVALQACLDRAFDELTAKHGFPVDLQGNVLNKQVCGIAIIGYGKLGGIEMGYSSDLDVVFLHRLADDQWTVGQSPDGAIKPITGMKFATRLVQKLITYLTTQTRDGRVYELDMRLRPSGNAGVMVVSVQGFAQYQADKAWAWEHQALVRARGICGDKQVLSAFDDIRQKTLTKQRDRSEVTTDVLAMRQKMYDHFTQSYKPKSDDFHLKYSYGGLIDIEFMAQFLVLAFAYQHKSLAVWSDNVRIFECVAQVGLLDKATCDTLTNLYLQLRKSAHLLALDSKTRLIKGDDWITQRQTIQSIWTQVFTNLV